MQRMTKEGKQKNPHRNVDAQQKEKLQKSANNVISYVCKLAALVICVIIFASTIVDNIDVKFVILGLSLSIALVVIALLQDLHHKR